MVLDDSWVQTLHSSIGMTIYEQLGSTTTCFDEYKYQYPYSIAENGEIVMFQDNSKRFTLLWMSI